MAGIRTCDRESQVQRPNHLHHRAIYFHIAEISLRTHCLKIHSVELFIYRTSLLLHVRCFSNFRLHCSSGFRQVAIKGAGDPNPNS